MIKIKMRIENGVRQGQSIANPQHPWVRLDSEVGYLILKSYFLLHFAGEDGATHFFPNSNLDDLRASGCISNFIGSFACSSSRQPGFRVVSHRCALGHGDT